MAIIAVNGQTKDYMPSFFNRNFVREIRYDTLKEVCSLILFHKCPESPLTENNAEIYPLRILK